jgi:hypothetical protein
MAVEIAKMTRHWLSCLVVLVDCYQLEAEHLLAHLKTLSITTLLTGNTATLVTRSKILRTPSWTGEVVMRLIHQVKLHLLLLLQLQSMGPGRKSLYRLYRFL